MLKEELKDSPKGITPSEKKPESEKRKFEALPKEELRRLRQEAKKIPISQIISSRIHVDSDGGCLCPFHDDKEAGSFQFSDEKAYFNCFSCGEKGDGVDFVQKLENKNFVDSLLEVSAQFGLISREDYKKYTGEEFSLEMKDYKPVLVESRLEKERGPIEINDLFYRELQRLCPLSPAHKSYLLGRGLSETQILENGYFTMPMEKNKLEDYFNSEHFKEKFNNLINSEKISVERIPRLNSEKAVPTYYATNKNIRVPGFYTDESGRIKLSNQSGLIIPIKDYRGRYDGLQIRMDRAMPDGTRYFWFTSSKFDGGASAGAPIDVNYPELLGGKKLDKSICIMEGHFKAVQVSKISHAICVSVQGVRNTAGLIEEINNIMSIQEQKDRASVIRIMFDMDMYKNPQVFDALKELNALFKGNNLMMQNIEATYVNGKLTAFDLPFALEGEVIERKPFVVLQTWDPKEKGVDDYILSGGRKLVSQMCSDFIEKYQRDFLPLIPANLRNLPPAEKEKKEQELEAKFKEMFVDNIVPFETHEQAFLRESKELNDFYNALPREA